MQRGREKSNGMRTESTHLVLVFASSYFLVSGGHKRDVSSSHLLHCYIVKIFSPIFKLIFFGALTSLVQSNQVNLQPDDYNSLGAYPKLTLITFSILIA